MSTQVERERLAAPERKPFDSKNGDYLLEQIEGCVDDMKTQLMSIEGLLSEMDLPGGDAFEVSDNDLDRAVKAISDPIEAAMPQDHGDDDGEGRR